MSLTRMAAAFQDESAAGSCQETGAGGHGADDEADACDCASCRSTAAFLDVLADRHSHPPSRMFPLGSKLPAGPMPSDYKRGRATLEILAEHWPRA